MTPVFIRCVESRRAVVQYLLTRLPHARVIPDTEGDCWHTFKRALDAAGGKPSIHLEDDIVLTEGFVTKVEQALTGHRNEVVQMFSMRPAKDLTVGSRYDRDFMMTQCFYLPAGYGPAIVAHIAEGDRPIRDPGGIDLGIGDFLRSRRERYWLHVPSLVQHLDVPSAIAHRRNMRRQSQTFTAPDWRDHPEAP